MAINLWLKSFFPRILNTRVGFRFYRLVDIIIRVFLGFKVSGNSIFGGVSKWEKIICHDASTTLFKVIRKLVSWVRSVDIRDRENIIKIGLLFSGKKNLN